MILLHGDALRRERINLSTVLWTAVDTCSHRRPFNTAPRSPDWLYYLVLQSVFKSISPHQRSQNAALRAAWAAPGPLSERQILDPHPRLLSQKLQGCDTVVCALTSPQVALMPVKDSEPPTLVSSQERVLSQPQTVKALAALTH